MGLGLKLDILIFRDQNRLLTTISFNCFLLQLAIVDCIWEYFVDWREVFHPRLELALRCCGWILDFGLLYNNLGEF